MSDINFLPHEERENENGVKKPPVARMHQPEEEKKLERPHTPVKPVAHTALKPEPREPIPPPRPPQGMSPLPVSPQRETTPSPPFERTWHDVPPPPFGAEEIEVDLIPGIVKSLQGLKRWIAVLIAAAVALVVLIAVVTGFLVYLTRKAEAEYAEEQQHIVILQERVRALDEKQGLLRDFQKQVKAFQEWETTHRDWRALFSLFEGHLIKGVLFNQFRADTEGIVVIEAQAPDIAHATAQTRHFQSLFGDSSVVLSEIRTVNETGKISVVFTIRLQLPDSFWEGAPL